MVMTQKYLLSRLTHAQVAALVEAQLLQPAKRRGEFRRDAALCAEHMAKE